MMLKLILWMFVALCVLMLFALVIRRARKPPSNSVSKSTPVEDVSSGGSHSPDGYYCDRIGDSSGHPDGCQCYSCKPWR